MTGPATYGAATIASATAMRPTQTGTATSSNHNLLGLPREGWIGPVRISKLRRPCGRTSGRRHAFARRSCWVRAHAARLRMMRAMRDGTDHLRRPDQRITDGHAADVNGNRDLLEPRPAGRSRRRRLDPGPSELQTPAAMRPNEPDDGQAADANGFVCARWAATVVRTSAQTGRNRRHATFPQPSMPSPGISRFETP